MKDMGSDNGDSSGMKFKTGEDGKTPRKILESSTRNPTWNDREMSLELQQWKASIRTSQLLSSPFFKCKLL